LRIVDFGLRILRASVVRHDLRSSQSAIRNPKSAIFGFRRHSFGYVVRRRVVRLRW